MDKELFLKNLGLNIRAERKKQNLSRQSLAEKSGMSIEFLGGIERAEQNPSVLKILDIANALNIPVSNLLNTEK
jgi:transcriptional regulator with XRE-family HTH domain